MINQLLLLFACNIQQHVLHHTYKHRECTSEWPLKASCHFYLIKWKFLNCTLWSERKLLDKSVESGQAERRVSLAREKNIKMVTHRSAATLKLLQPIWNPTGSPITRQQPWSRNHCARAQNAKVYPESRPTWWPRDKLPRPLYICSVQLARDARARHRPWARIGMHPDVHGNSRVSKRERAGPRSRSPWGFLGCVGEPIHMRSRLAQGGRGLERLARGSGDGLSGWLGDLGARGVGLVVGGWLDFVGFGKRG